MKPRIRTRSLLGLVILMSAAQLLTSSVYRFKTHRTVPDLQICNISYAARKYSLITPSSTFRR